MSYSASLQVRVYGGDIAASTLPAAEILGELINVSFLHTVSPSHVSEEWSPDAVLRRGRTMARARVNGSLQLPVEVSLRLSHLFDHELQALRRYIPLSWVYQRTLCIPSEFNDFLRENGSQNIEALIWLLAVT